jgi:cell volume regulation protein A
MFILGAGVARGSQIYAIIFIVVLVSVVVQGGLVPLFASLFRVPMRRVEAEPWALGLRFNQEPRGLHRHTVAPGSLAEGRTVADLALGDAGWISIVRRDGELVQVRGSTRFEAGDVVLALGEPDAGFSRFFD